MPTGEVTVTPKGQEYDVEWKMNFTSILKEGGTGYASPDFSFEGESWCLAIRPNGMQYTESSGYIDLRVFRRTYNVPPINVQFFFALKTLNGKKDLERQNTEVFEENSGHDIVRFMSKSDFQNRQSEFLSSAYLTVLCTLKRSNSTGSFSNISTTNCSYCKNAFDSPKLSFHEKKCRVKCPECSDVLLLQNWDEHECQISRIEAKTNTTEPFVVHSHDKILQDLKQVFLKQENCDVVLRVKGQEFQTHKVILAARSPVFASTFRNDMKEKKTGVVDIEDCDLSVFPDFLCFLYSDDVDSLTEENVFGLFTAADKYDIPDLRVKCVEFMKEHLSVETFCEILTLALQHNETELVHLTTEFFIKKAKKILVTCKWQSFAAKNPTQSNELFIKFVRACKCSES